MRLEDLFQNLELSLSFLVGPRHSRRPKIWNPQSSHSNPPPPAWIKNGNTWVLKK